MADDIIEIGEPGQIESLFDGEPAGLFLPLESMVIILGVSP